MSNIIINFYGIFINNWSNYVKEPEWNPTYILSCYLIVGKDKLNEFLTSNKQLGDFKVDVLKMDNITKHESNIITLLNDKLVKHYDLSNGDDYNDGHEGFYYYDDHKFPELDTFERGRQLLYWLNNEKTDNSV